jgi:hypothetical protein
MQFWMGAVASAVGLGVLNFMVATGALSILLSLLLGPLFPSFRVRKVKLGHIVHAAPRAERVSMRPAIPITYVFYSAAWLLLCLTHRRILSFCSGYLTFQETHRTSIT